MVTPPKVFVDPNGNPILIYNVPVLVVGPNVILLDVAVELPTSNAPSPFDGFMGPSSGGSPIRPTTPAASHPQPRGIHGKLPYGHVYLGHEHSPGNC